MQESELRFLLTIQQQENLYDGAVAFLRHEEEGDKGQPPGLHDVELQVRLLCYHAHHHDCHHDCWCSEWGIKLEVHTMGRVHSNQFS